MSLLESLVRLTGRWRLITLSTTTAFVLAALLSLLGILLPARSRLNPLAVRYTSTATLTLVQGSISQNLGASDTGLVVNRLLTRLAVSDHHDSDFAAALLLSNEVADRVAARFDFARLYHLKKNSRTVSREIFRRNMAASFNESDGLITVRYSDPDPLLSPEILGYAIDTVSGRFNDLARSAVIGASEKLHIQLGLADVEYRRALSQFVRYEAQHGITVPSAQFRAELGQVRSLAAQIIGVERRIESLKRIGYTPASILVQKLGQYRSVLDDTLRKVETGENQSSGVSDIPLYEVPRQQLVYGQLALELRLQRTILTNVANEYEKARLDSIGNSALLQVVDPPDMPERPSGMSRIGLSFLVAGLVFLLGAVVALFTPANRVGPRSVDSGDSRPTSTSSCTDR